MYGWGKPQFFGVKAAAANIGHSVGNYTVEDFRTDYPQFFNKEGYFLGSLPMLEQIIRMANGSIQPDRWLDGWRYAVGLYVAHYATLSLRGYAESNETPSRPPPPGRLWAWSRVQHWATPPSLTTPPPSRRAPRTGAT